LVEAFGRRERVTLVEFIEIMK